MKYKKPLWIYQNGFFAFCEFENTVKTRVVDLI